MARRLGACVAQGPGGSGGGAANALGQPANGKVWQHRRTIADYAPAALQQLPWQRAAALAEAEWSSRG